MTVTLLVALGIAVAQGCQNKAQSLAPAQTVTTQVEGGTDASLSQHH